MTKREAELELAKKREDKLDRENEQLKIELERLHSQDSEKNEVFKEIAKIQLEKDHLIEKVTKL